MKFSIALLFFLMYHFASAQTAKFLIPYRVGNKWGYCDTLGKVKINPQYSEVDFFNTYYGETVCAYSMVKKYFGDEVSKSVIDTLGKTIVPFGFADIVVVSNYKINYYIVTDKEKKIGIYKANKLVIQPTFDELENTQNNNFIVKIKDKYGLINDNGEYIIPVQYERISVSKKYSDTKKFVWLAKRGNSKTKFEDKVVEPYTDRFRRNNDRDELIEIQKNEDENRKKIAAGLVSENNNSSNKSKLPPLDNTVSIVDSSNIAIKPKTLLDSINDLIPILKNKYQLDTIARLFKNRYFYYVTKNKFTGIIDDSLKLFMLNKIYNIKELTINDTTSWLYSDYQSLAIFLVVENNKWGIINEFGDIVLPIEYDKIGGDRYEMALFKNNRKGVFLVNTIYKPIGAKYTNIFKAKALKVSNTWAYNVYEVEDEKGKKGFVGENGIEYFKN
jgi:WG containing repeat